MSFDSIQVFNPQAKDAFVQFLLGRINTFAQVCSENKWTEEHCWTPQDFERILEEYSVSSVVFPFSKAQLLVVVGWLRKDSKGDLLKRYSDQEIIAVLSQVKEGDNLNEYVLGLVQDLLDWDECPRGYSNGGADRERDLANSIIMEILNRPAEAAEDDVVDPPILDEGADEEETSLLEDAEIKEVENNDDDEENIEEEAEVEDIEEVEDAEAVEPPKTKKVTPPKTTPKITKKEEPKENFTPPKGVVLTRLVNSLIENYMEPAKAPSPSVIAEQRKKIVKYASERLGTKETLESFMKALVEQTIDVCDRVGKDEYDVTSLVIDAVAAYRSNTRNPKTA